MLLTVYYRSFRISTTLQETKPPASTDVKCDSSTFILYFHRTNYSALYFHTRERHLRSASVRGGYYIMAAAAAVANLIFDDDDADDEDDAEVRIL